MPARAWTEGIARQRVFLQGVLVETARRLREASPETRLVLLMGNDDWASNRRLPRAASRRLWEHVHDRAVTIDGIAVAGLSWVPITPFGIKDWERWEDGAPETPARSRMGEPRRATRAVPVRPGAAHAHDRRGARRSRRAHDPGAATVFVFHTPPREPPAT